MGTKLGIPRGPYRLRLNTVVCGRCNTKHKKNQCPKRIPRAIKIPVKQVNHAQLRDAHFRPEYRHGNTVPAGLYEQVQRDALIEKIARQHRNEVRRAHYQRQKDAREADIIVAHLAKIPAEFDE